MKKLNLFFWLIILIVVFFSRFYKLTTIPPHLTIDEVSIGYNAYSILKTGKDEWGNFLPVSFRSVGDYKAPTLIYLTVPFVYFFGLSDLATRLPVAIFSTLNVLLFWLLVKKYIFNKKFLYLPYIATFIFTVSPWLVPFYRSGFEAIVALTFFLANILLAFKYREDNTLLSFFLTIVFAYLSAISYHSTKIVVPLVNALFLLIDLKAFTNNLLIWYQKNKFLLIAVTILLGGITFFFFKYFIFGPGSSRGGMTFLVKDFEFNRALLPTYISHPLATITSTFGLLTFWFKRYLEYFSANFYLSTGLGIVTPGHPGQGVIYSVEYLFLFIGMALLLLNTNFAKKIFASNFVRTMLLFWLFIAFLPGSITNNSQHPLRTLNVVPVIAVFITLGLSFVYLSLVKLHLKYFFIFLVFIGYVFGVTKFVDYYTLHYPVELSEARSYGWKQMALYAQEHHLEYDHVYVDPRFGTQGPYTYGVPYLYFLFYSGYNPSLYNQSPERKDGGSNFANYIFEPIDWPNINHSQNNLYIASPWSFPIELINSPHQKYYIEFLNKSSGLYAISDR